MRIEEIYDRMESGPLGPVWISLVPREVSLKRARAAEGPLAGLTFAIKDNIDLEGLPTTAGCPAYAYQPERSATVVDKLMKAGAIPIGKTNMDQFATGLVGTRSPYGACSSVFDERYISGGSSAGSAVAVAKGLVDFSLGTDTAGSGRVPAAFNGIVGLKPTRGLLSTSGVVPACRSLDCVSIFAHDCRVARRVWEVARGFDPADPYSRVTGVGQDAAPWLWGSLRFGVPAEEHLEFFGDDEARKLYMDAADNLEDFRGAQRVEIDFSVFQEAAALLYSGPWVAERLAAIGGFMDEHSEEMNPVVREILEGARKYSAVDAFEAEYKLRELRRRSEVEWRKMDVMLLPTTGTIYTHQQVAAEPIKLNSNLGCYTNFVNLLDLAAVSVDGGCRFLPGGDKGLPFGVSLIGPAFSDSALLTLAELFPAGGEVDVPQVGCVAVAVVGAHLSGQSLNWQLTERGARLMKTCRTAPGYRLYALDRTVPPKPGLVRDSQYEGSGIEVEVWAVPEDRFGGFVAAVPAPLGIGNATLDSGEVVKCFICEGYAIENATEITSFGGWRNYLRGSRG
jgi:allophanate hydrolase